MDQESELNNIHADDPHFAEKLAQQIQISICDLENLLRVAPEASMYIEEVMAVMRN
jgi:hypothetical protein